MHREQDFILSARGQQAFFVTGPLAKEIHSSSTAGQNTVPSRRLRVPRVQVGAIPHNEPVSYRFHTTQILIMADAAGAKEPPGAILRPAAPKLDGKTAPSTRQGSPRKLSAPRHHKSLDARRGNADGGDLGRAPRAGALMKCCCPPCAVYMHEGPGVPRGPAWRVVFLDERSGGSPASTRVERRPGDAASCKRRPARAGASPLSAWGPGTRCLYLLHLTLVRCRRPKLSPLGSRSRRRR